jgi:hypothetical protein
MEEDQSSCPSTMIASIGVVTSHDKFKKSARIGTGGGVPRHTLAPRASSSGNNPFDTLITSRELLIASLLITGALVFYAPVVKIPPANIAVCAGGKNYPWRISLLCAGDNSHTAGASK